jgi:hypothetical protein
MRKLLRTILALVGIVAVVTFAIGNRHAVEVSFWPLPLARAVPVYGILLIGMALGVLLGAVATWLSGHSRRVAYRDLRQRTTGLEYREQQRRAAEEAAAAQRATTRLPSPAH